MSRRICKGGWESRVPLLLTKKLKKTSSNSLFDEMHKRAAKSQILGRLDAWASQHWMPGLRPGVLL
jgi:hypothetical protein